MRATKSAKVSYVETIAKIIEGSDGEEEVIVKRADLIGFVSEVGAKAEAGAAYSDAFAAVRNSQIHPKLMATLTDVWTNVVNRARVVPMSQLGLEQLARQSLAAAKALIPMTRSVPDDAILEIAMMAILLRIKDVCR